MFTKIRKSYSTKTERVYNIHSYLHIVNLQIPMLMQKRTITIVNAYEKEAFRMIEQINLRSNLCGFLIGILFVYNLSV